MSFAESARNTDEEKAAALVEAMFENVYPDTAFLHEETQKAEAIPMLKGFNTAIKSMVDRLYEEGYVNRDHAAGLLACVSIYSILTVAYIDSELPDAPPEA